MANKITGINRQIGRYYNVDNKPFDASYGPWESWDDFYLNILFAGNTDSFSSLTEEDKIFKLNNIKPGLTIAFIENGKVVEYWNPVAGQGFIKKSPNIIIDGDSDYWDDELLNNINTKFEQYDIDINTIKSQNGEIISSLGDLNDKLDNLDLNADTKSNYSDALGLATSDNIGKLIYVYESEEINGVVHPSGLYVVVGDNQLEYVGCCDIDDSDVDLNDELVNDIYSKLKELGVDISTVSGRVDTVEGKVTDVDDKIGSVIGDVNAIKDNESAINTAINDLKDKIGDLGSKTEIVKNYSDALGLATSDNVGELVYTIEPEVVDGIIRPSGLYIIMGDNQLEYIGTYIDDSDADDSDNWNEDVVKIIEDRIKELKKEVKNYIDNKSILAERVADYSTALIFANSDNLGKLIYVVNSETIDDKVYPKGLYIVTDVNRLEIVGSDSNTPSDVIGGIDTEWQKRIETVIENNEFVVSAALNDLNNKINNISSLTERVADYSTALELATSDNIGKLIYIVNSETINNEEHPKGLYVVSDSNKLEIVGSDSSIGSGDVSDILKYLDDMNDVFEDSSSNDHTYVSKIAKNDNSIIPIYDDFDTKKILMEGNNEDDTNKFLTVSGVEIGGFKSGDVIPNGMSMEEFIKKLLVKELPVTSHNPDFNITGVTSSTKLEVGTKLSGTMGYDFKQGYFTCDGKTTNANCAVTNVVYTPSQNYDFNVTSGNNVFKANLTYSGNTIIVKNNLGNITNVIIKSGSIEKTKTIKGCYKVWYGFSNDHNPLSISFGTSSNGEYASFINNLTQIYHDENIYIPKESDFEGGKYFYIVCPSSYKVFVGQLGGTAELNDYNDNLVEYILPNGEKMNYRIYAIIAKGNYEKTYIQ